MTDGDDRGQRALTARFIASVMVPEAAETERLQERLDAVLAQPDALRAVFQPIVRLDNRTTSAYEGLMRFPRLVGGGDTDSMVQRGPSARPRYRPRICRAPYGF